MLGGTLDEDLGTLRAAPTITEAATRLTSGVELASRYPEARALAAPKSNERWLLVTSAAHMPRSVGIFRKAGWPVIAYPVDYRTFGSSRDWRPTSESLDSLRRLDIALHEWIGLALYRATGKTDVLFPAP